MAAARRPPSSEPAKVQFLLPTATARSSRSAALFDMHRRPSSRKRVKASQLTLPPSFIVLSSREFAPAVGFARLGGGSDGSWRGALGKAQRRIPSRMAGEGELGRRSPSELRVRPGVVVIGPPASERYAGLGQRGEQRLVQ